MLAKIKSSQKAAGVQSGWQTACRQPKKTMNNPKKHCLPGRSSSLRPVNQILLIITAKKPRISNSRSPHLSRHGRRRPVSERVMFDPVEHRVAGGGWMRQGGRQERKRRGRGWCSVTAPRNWRVTGAQSDEQEEAEREHARKGCSGGRSHVEANRLTRTQPY